MSTVYVVIQRLCYRKRRHVTSCYTYSSHGLFYVLFLLIYGNFLIHAPTIILAETTTNDAKIGNSHDDDTKKPIEIDKLSAAIKLEDADDEYFDDDKEEKEYQELISNKSGVCSLTTNVSFPLFSRLRSANIKCFSFVHAYFPATETTKIIDHILSLAKGMYIGAPCDELCSVKLHHVICERATNTCACEKKYPVVIGLTKGCAKRNVCFKTLNSHFAAQLTF